MNKRLPTIYEWQELIDNCTWKWDDEKKGMTITGKNGNNIFLPADGYSYGKRLNNVGYCGYYWSSSLYTDVTESMWEVYFTSDDVDCDQGNNYYGQSIHLVSTSQQEGFIDLALPSGLLWAENNAEGYYTYDEAMKLFKDEEIEGNGIEIPFGANDSELKGWSYIIPEGYEAEIKDGKIIVKEKESEEEKEKIRQNDRMDVCYNPEKYGLCHKTEWSEIDKEKLIRHCIGLILTDATDERFKDYGLTLKDCLTWLGEQKEQDKCPEYCIRSHCIGCPIYEKQKEQKPAEWSEEDVKRLYSIRIKLLIGSKNYKI